jgi:hypothetical protein
MEWKNSGGHVIHVASLREDFIKSVASMRFLRLVSTCKFMMLYSVADTLRNAPESVFNPLHKAKDENNN